MATGHERSGRAEAVEGFFLHCLMAMHLQAIASKALGSAGFSMTKHRILGFATITPGITVGRLVQTLHVTNQALNRPLRSLIDEGYVMAKAGVEDRREKQLFSTRKGSRLYLKIIAETIGEVDQGFRAAGPEAARGFLEVHRRLVTAGQRQWVEIALKVVEQGERTI